MGTLTIERRPLALTCAWVIMMALLAPLYMTVPPSPDQSQFDWMAYIAIQGQPYYAGSFDMNWPGAMLLHELGIRLFGVHGWTWRLTDFLLLAGFTLSGSIFLVRSGWQLASIVFLFLYPPLYITAGSWMAGERDIIATGFLLMACTLAVPGGRREGLAVLLAGLCVAAAVLIRPTFLSFIAGLILLEALPLRSKRARRLGRQLRAAGFATGLVAGLGAAVAAGLLLGNLDDWYQQSIEFSFSTYVGEPPQQWRDTLYTLFIRSWHWITVLALVGVAIWAIRDRLSYGLILMLGVGATSAVSFVVQNKGFGYHLSGLLTILVLFNAVALEGVVQLCRKPRSGPWQTVAYGGLCLLSALVLAGTASKLMSLQDGAWLILSGRLEPVAGHGLTEAERRAIVDVIRDSSSPNETILIYGTNFELAYRAERLPPHKFINSVIDQTSPDFPHYDEWMTEIDTGISHRQPAYILIRRSAVRGPIDNPISNSAGRQVLMRLIRMIGEGYIAIFNNDHIIVYKKAERRSD